MLDETIIYFSKFNNEAAIPQKRDEDAGYDIYSCFAGKQIIIHPGEIAIIPSGISTAFSSKYVLFVKERSSTGAIGLSVRMGVVDSGYRGEIKVAVNNTSNIPIEITKETSEVIRQVDLIKYPYSKAIAQCVLCLVPKLDVKEVDRATLLSLHSDRGESLFGASGK
jgi:dUTP pyrophosphatase